MKLYLIAGEDSGDLHGKNLLKALQARQPDLQVRGIGGNLLQAAGMELVAHIRDTNFMGFWEVIRNLGTIRRLFHLVKADIEQWQPDAILLIDYPGFNLRMARYCRERGIPVYYYISPQVWAWKKGRVKKIRQDVDRLMVILPFEKDFFEQEGVEVDFVGHPLLDEIGPEETAQDPGKRRIALLPGSRKQEIERMLPVMLAMVEKFPGYEFIVAGAPSQEAAFYAEMIGGRPVQLWMNRTYELLRSASFALVTSGTATLETGLFGVPQVVCYRGSRFSYLIFRRLIQVKYISLINLILDQPLLSELIQDEFNPQRLETELRALMTREKGTAIRAGYQELRLKLGQQGASERAADLLLGYLRATS